MNIVWQNSFNSGSTYTTKLLGYTCFTRFYNQSVNTCRSMCESQTWTVNRLFAIYAFCLLYFLSLCQRCDVHSPLWLISNPTLPVSKQSGSDFPWGPCSFQEACSAIKPCRRQSGSDVFGNVGHTGSVGNMATVPGCQWADLMTDVQLNFLFHWTVRCSIHTLCKVSKYSSPKLNILHSGAESCTYTLGVCQLSTCATDSYWLNWLSFLWLNDHLHTHWL